MMHSEAFAGAMPHGVPGGAAAEATRFDPPLPPPRDKLPTLPFELEEYARWSCLPDADDELVFTAGSPLDEMTGRVPRVVAAVDLGERLSPLESLVLSLVDGLSPVCMLLELVGGSSDEALVVLCDLYARGLVAFD